MIKFFLIASFLCFQASAEIGKRIRNEVLFSARTTTGNSDNVSIPYAGVKTFQATGTTSSGAGAATVLVKGSNVDSSVETDWETLCTLTITLSTTSAGSSCVTHADFKFLRARVSAISGTGAAVYVYASGGVE